MKLSQKLDRCQSMHKANPLAWIKKSKFGTPELVWNLATSMHYDDNVAGPEEIPLYAHQEKELSEAELVHIWESKLCNQKCPRGVYLAFYKEIRKAQLAIEKS